MSGNFSEDYEIYKELSENDTGETGGHQAGVLIPKKPEILSFFPKLTSETKNPRAKLVFTGPSGEKWDLSFIYYNNKFLGGTRNEFRLTGLTKFYRKHQLHSGDRIILKRSQRSYFIDFSKRKTTRTDRVVLGTSWKIVKI